MRQSPEGMKQNGPYPWYPRVVQSVEIRPAHRVHDAWYRVKDDIVDGAFTIELTGGGTSNNVIAMELPIPASCPNELAASASSQHGTCIGSGFYLDAGTGLYSCLLIVPGASNTMTFPGPDFKGGGKWFFFQYIVGAAPLGNGGGSQTFGAAANDVLSGTFSYNCAPQWHRGGA